MWLSLMTADPGHNNAGARIPQCLDCPRRAGFGQVRNLTGLPSMHPAYRVERSEPTMDTGTQEAFNSTCRGLPGISRMGITRLLLQSVIADQLSGRLRIPDAVEGPAYRFRASPCEDYGAYDQRNQAYERGHRD